MKTFKRICIKDYDHPDCEKLLERGKEYITSEPKNGKVFVFTKYWFEIDKKYFVSPVRFT